MCAGTVAGKVAVPAHWKAGVGPLARATCPTRAASLRSCERDDETLGCDASVDPTGAVGLLATESQLF
jgi:hypothetical protein